MSNGTARVLARSCLPTVGSLSPVPLLFWELEAVVLVLLKVWACIDFGRHSMGYFVLGVGFEQPHPIEECLHILGFGAAESFKYLIFALVYLLLLLLYTTISTSTILPIVRRLSWSCKTRSPYREPTIGRHKKKRVTITHIV
jgi:hypothetical protein